ncbi:MAG: M28 family peptidase [Pseudoalteromonas prydzensis]
MQQLGYQSQLQTFNYTAGFFTEMSGQNVVATLMPAHPVKAHVILTAHYDHLGKQGHNLYAGANDNASGVSALLFIAAQFADTTLSFQLSFVATDAEENGLHGAKFFVSQLQRDDSITVLNINLDMLAVSRPKKTLYAFTSHAQRQALQHQLSGIFSDTIKVKVTSSSHRMNRLSRGGKIDWRRASDHYAFAKAGFAYIYFGMGYDPHHHKSSDQLSNIDQQLYIEAVNYIAQFIDQLDMTKL